MRRRFDLTDLEWSVIEPLLPKEALNGQYTEVEGGLGPLASAAVTDGNGRQVGQTFTVGPNLPIKLPPFSGHTTNGTGASAGFCP